MPNDGNCGSYFRVQSDYNNSITLNKPMLVHRYGLDFGLIVLIDQQIDDYAYTMHSNVGTRIMVYDPRNFPDSTSGAIKEKFIGRHEEMFLSIRPMPVNGSVAMKHYSKETRNCVFEDEIALMYKK